MGQKTDLLEISDEESSKLFESTDELFDDDLLESLQKRKQMSLKSKIVFADVFVDVYDCFRQKTLLIKNNELRSRVESFLSRTKPLFLSIRDYLEDYGDGKKHGNWFDGERIRIVVGENRDVMDSLVDNFFKIFREELDGSS